MVCAEKQRLLDAFQYAAEKHSAAVSELDRTMTTLSKSEYDSLYRMAQALYAEVIRAHAELQTHVNAHRC